ncbi:MAG: phosphoribosyl-AMP cyclohydrolase [Caldilineaceae bacterium]|nr:phosphoribosyl-AMP cyclohydrolase [Caldilineaceae bacterium]
MNDFVVFSASLPVEEFIAQVHFNAAGLVPAVVQDAVTGRVLMLAWMNAVSLEQTLSTGETVFWSRSRGELWHKGATSGHVQPVVDLLIDCDGDTLLVLVNPAGPACHTGAETCFFRAVSVENGNL